MMKSSEKREFLLKDFDAIFGYRISFSAMRLGALGASLTILGLVVSLGKGTQFPAVLGVYTIMLIVVFASIRIIAAINRGIFVFSNHIKWIEKELGEVGFSTYWGNYLRHNVKDSGSYAFVVASRVINFAISTYVILGAWTTIAIEAEVVLRSILSAIVTIVSIFMFFWNEYHIHKELDPRGFMDRISKGLNEARAEALGRESE